MPTADDRLERAVQLLNNHLASYGAEAGFHRDDEEWKGCPPLMQSSVPPAVAAAAALEDALVAAATFAAKEFRREGQPGQSADEPKPVPSPDLSACKTVPAVAEKGE